MPDSVLQTIAVGVKRRRHDLGYSQEQLAELAGLHRTYVGAVERAERNLSVRSLERIATALGCTVAALVSPE